MDGEMEAQPASPESKPNGSANDPSEKKSPKGTVYICEERCKGCSYCVIFCPTNALAMGGRLNQKGYHLPELADPQKCNGCDMCGLYCPDFAIFGVRLRGKKKEGSR